MFMIVNRGSTFYGKITLTNDSGIPVQLSDDDCLIFCVKKDYEKNNSPNILIRKSLYPYDELDGSYTFMLTAEDTDIPAGTYYYDIALQCGNGEFYQIINTDEFIIKESVSRKEDAI